MFKVFFQPPDPLRASGKLQAPSRRPGPALPGGDSERRRPGGGGSTQLFQGTEASTEKTAPTCPGRGAAVGVPLRVLTPELLFPEWGVGQVRGAAQLLMPRLESGGGPQAALCCPRVAVRRSCHGRWSRHGTPPAQAASSFQTFRPHAPGAPKERTIVPSSLSPIPHVHRSLATRERSADLFDGDGPAAPDAVHLAVGSLLVPVQVGPLPRLQEKRRGALRGPRVHGGQQPTWTPLPSPPPSSWAGPSRGRAGAAGPGRNGDTSSPMGLFLHTAPYRAAQVTEPGPPLTGQQGHGIPRARGARTQPRGLGLKRREGARRGGRWG